VEFISFKAYEVAFMKAAELGRLATIQRDGTPQVSPVGFTYNEELGTIDISGYNMAKSQKFRNVAHHDKAAFVVDDIASRDPWRVRCLEIRGTAKQVVAAQGEPGAAGDALESAIIRITPHRIISFGINDTATEPRQLKADSRNV
jgi:pyridoxamine 5'-phosphate oxidase family protein